MGIHSIYQRITSKYWIIGFSERKPIKELNFHDIRWVHRIKGEWCADPFILDYDENTITVLVEYVIDPNPNGKIAKFVIDRKTFCIINKKIILDLPTHLSFPAILRIGNDIYIYPENSASGELNLYKLNSDATSCEYTCTLVKAPLTDAIIFHKDDGFYMTATEEPESNGNKFKFYESDNIFGPYQFIREFIMNDNTARNGGYTLTNENGILYKISQENNSPIYGHGMVFYSINSSFQFTKIKQIKPGGRFIGIHTMNPYKDIIAWDGKKYNFFIVATVVVFIANRIKQLKNYIHNSPLIGIFLKYENP